LRGSLPGWFGRRQERQQNENNKMELERNLLECREVMQSCLPEAESDPPGGEELSEAGAYSSAGASKRFAWSSRLRIPDSGRAKPPQTIRQLNVGLVNETLVRQVWDVGFPEWRFDEFWHLEG
jgi:hypothetical protein